MKKLIPAILILLMLAVLPVLGSAEQNNYCDPVPVSLQTEIDGIPQDCIVLDAPDGSTHVVLITELGYGLECYRLSGGQWEQVFGGLDAADGSTEARLVRHRADQLRPDGTPYGDDQGFDVVSMNGICDSYHWDGESYSLCGWSSPERYSGQVMIQGTVLKYYPEGSTVPECEMDAGDDLTLFGWTAAYADRPAAPQEAEKKAALLPAAVQDDFPGMELVEFVPFIAPIEATAVFAAVVDDPAAGGLILRSVYVVYDSDHEMPAITISLIDVPLSGMLKDIPVKELWENSHDLLTRPGAMDSGRLPVQGKIRDFDLQHNQMVLLTEDEQGARRIVIAEQKTPNTYSLLSSGVLPADSWLDTFHAGEDEIQIEFDNQKWCAGYRRASSGWQLDWIMGDGADHMNCTVLQWGVICNCTSVDEGYDYPYVQLIGSLSCMDLLTTDFVSIPRTVDALKQSLVQDGWAVVCNPDPEDRLHLRPEAGSRDKSLGMFYNGTPVQVLETKGDWCRVQICTDGPEGWMLKKYLAFGEKMNSVIPAFPNLNLLEEYENQSAWTDPKMTFRDNCSLNDVTWRIVGVIDDKYILLYNNGTVAYAYMNWFWAGNG